VPFVVIALVVVVAAVCLAVMWVLAEYVLPSPSDEAFSRLANVPRRHLESLASWRKRCSAAYEVRDRASEAFIAAAEYQDTGPRSGLYSLSAAHPASIAYLAARYPDGPPLDRLLNIGTEVLRERVVRLA